MRRIIALIVIIALLLVSCGTIPDPSDGTDEKTPSDGTEPSVPDEPVTPDDKPEPIAPDDQPDPVSPDEEPYDARSAAEILLANMTLEEKVGQLFLIRPDSLDPYLTPDQVNETYLYGHTEATSAMLDTLQNILQVGSYSLGKTCLTLLRCRVISLLCLLSPIFRCFMP